MIRILTRFGLAAFAFFAMARADAVILLSDGNPATNTTAPTGALAGSGWQFQGMYGPFLGTAIAPQFFITAKHVTGSGSNFIYSGTTYNLVQAFHDPFSDLTVWQVSGTLPSFAPLYASGGETGQPLVVIGRGTQRGAQVLQNNVLRGWMWGGGDGVQRWGQNVVSSIVHDGPLNQYVFAAFDESGGTNEAHLSSGDSGGAVFVQESGTWKLAGINYAVDGPFYTDAAGNGGFFGALFDARDFYNQDGSNPPHFSVIAGATAVPSGFYATRISSKLGWIYSVIDPTGDANGNGISNRVEYALSLNQASPTGLGQPTLVKEGANLAMTYRRLSSPGAPQYVVQQSDDLQTWLAATSQETLVRVDGDVQTVQASVPASGGRFLRVRLRP